MLWRRYFGDRLMVASFDDLDYAPSARQLLERLLSHVGIEPPAPTVVISRDDGWKQDADDDDVTDGPSWRTRPLQRRRARSNRSRTERPCPLACDVYRRLLDYYAPHNALLYEAEPQLTRFGVFCCRDNEPAKLGKIALTVRGLRRRSSR